VVNLSIATLKFAMKYRKTDSAYLIEKIDSDFNKSQATAGIVTVELSAIDTNQDMGNYVGELKTTFSASNIDKSADIDIQIDRAVITD